MTTTLLGWRVWYDGGRMFDSKDTDWKDMPPDGVQMVVSYFSDGERYMSGCDYYFKAGDVIGSNNDSPQSIRMRYRGASVKRGRWTSDEEIARIKIQAREPR